MKERHNILPLSLAAGLLVVMVAFADSVSQEEGWIAFYDGPGEAWDEPASMVVDSSGNVYVTGTSEASDGYEDYATVKYDMYGNEQWVERYRGSPTHSGQANAMALGPSGNVYVTGRTFETSDDCSTIKYDADGNRLWVRRYDSGTYDGPNAIAVDGAGNVYITGLSGMGGYMNNDVLTVKYDTDGNELWVAGYDGPGNSWDLGEALAVDGSGNVYVTGYGYGDGTWNDYVTIKYDSLGNELWVARYDGPASFHDYAKGLALDEAGNVFVTGTSAGGTTWDDYATIKYDPGGTELWVVRYDGADSRMDGATAVALDDLGNVYVTGNSEKRRSDPDDPSLHKGYVTIKYDPDGNELWVRRYDAPGEGHDVATHLALDTLGNVYVAGYSEMEYRWHWESLDLAVGKYDPDGNELWVARYGGPTYTQERPYALAVDGTGSVYISARTATYATGQSDYVTIKNLHAFCADEDGDGYGNPCEVSNWDCNDRVPSVNPGGPELCNTYDDDCDGVIDEGEDDDGDGWSTCAGDCDDANPNVNPDMEEIPGNGIDDDCDNATPFWGTPLSMIGSESESGSAVGNVLLWVFLPVSVVLIWRVRRAIRKESF